MLLRAVGSKVARWWHICGWLGSRSCGCARNLQGAGAAGSGARTHREIGSLTSVHCCGQSLVHFNLQMRPTQGNREQRKVLKILGNWRVQPRQVGLADRRIQPLSHLSAVGSAEANRPKWSEYVINEGHKGSGSRKKCWCWADHLEFLASNRKGRLSDPGLAGWRDCFLSGDLNIEWMTLGRAAPG